MAKNFRILMAAAIAACDAEVDLIDDGAGTAKLQFYTGTQPDNPSVAISDQVLVAEVDLPNPAFGAAADPGGGAEYAEAELNSVPLEDTSANNSGTITWYRILDRDGNALFDGSAGISSGDFNALIDNPVVVAGQTFRATSLVHRVPLRSGV